MTSRRSPPRRSSGNNAAFAVLLSLAVGASAAEAHGADKARGGGSGADQARGGGSGGDQARGGDARRGDAAPAGALQESRAGVSIDWQTGTLGAAGGAAADLRMPTVDLARPGAERRAHAAALAKLRAALAALPLGGGHTLGASEIDRVLGRARTLDTQYQSNGGAVTRLEVRFADWIEQMEPPTVTLTVPAMRLGAAPPATVAGREIRVGAATFRLGPAPAGSNAVVARVDRAGRLVVDAGADLASKLAGGIALIYVQKVQK